MQDSDWVDSMLVAATTPDTILSHLDGRISQMEGQLLVLKAVRQALGGHTPPMNSDVTPLSKKVRGRAEDTKSKLRDSMAMVIRRDGPMESNKLKELVGASDAYFYEVIRDPYFVKDGGRWTLTNEGFLATKSENNDTVNDSNKE